VTNRVRRNRKRFPADFVFRLTADEAAALRSQNATLKPGRGAHRKYRPYAFTEHGAIMAANVLNSPRAVEVGVYVVCAFVKLRQLTPRTRNWPKGSPSWSNAWTIATTRSGNSWHRHPIRNGGTGSRARLAYRRSRSLSPSDSATADLRRESK
jgi:hypothetical protein